MYVPAYPLPLLEIGSFITANLPDVDVRIISVPMDYGLPLSRKAKNLVYRQLIQDILKMKPKGIGISCTAIAQAEELINLCDLIKAHVPDVFIFIGGYFPTIYYEEILSKTSAVDLVVVGEGEIPALQIIELLEKNEDPKAAQVPSTAWKRNGLIQATPKDKRFDLKKKAYLDLKLLKYPKAYDVLPYAFSRGCPHKCNFCMEGHIRPNRREVPESIINTDLTNLLDQANTSTVLVSDALFKSFEIFPLLRSVGAKVNFETRCDILTPSILREVADVCAGVALGLESASYNTLRRMNKVRNRSHYREYLSNTLAIFKEAVHCKIPLLVFMIAGYPGETEEDLKESLHFAQELSKYKGPGGHLFKIGECHVYPKTKTYDFALSLPDIVFDNDGVFGQNIVRQPSKNLGFETTLAYVRQIFKLSNHTSRLQKTLLSIMPFFRLPADALKDELIPDKCFKDKRRDLVNVHGESLAIFKRMVPKLAKKYREAMSAQRQERSLDF
jgi:radical SAM superfamily enzyme YgiQ (UPF0313 family)